MLPRRAFYVNNGDIKSVLCLHGNNFIHRRSFPTLSLIVMNIKDSKPVSMECIQGVTGNVFLFSIGFLGWFYLQHAPSPVNHHFIASFCNFKTNKPISASIVICLPLSVQLAPQLLSCEDYCDYMEPNQRMQENLSILIFVS